MEKKIRNTNLLDMLTSEEFVDFCNKKLIPELASLENGCVYIAVKSNFKNWFDNFSLLNDSNSLLYENQNISVDLEMIFSIIDTLHANESIGM